MKKKIIMKIGHKKDIWFIVIRTTYIQKDTNRLKEYREQIIDIAFSKESANKKFKKRKIK